MISLTFLISIIDKNGNAAKKCKRVAPAKHHIGRARSGHLGNDSEGGSR